MPPLRSRSRVNRVLQRCAAPVAAASLAAAAAACGSGSASTPGASALARITATPAPKPDQCVVGTWKSNDVTGTISYASVGGADSVPLSGGGGDVMAIHPDGSFSTDYGREVPQTGMGSDGATYVITTTGFLDGMLATSGGELTQVFGASASPHISVTKNGAGFRGGDLTSPQIFGYRCSAGTSLTLTQGGLSQVWVSS